MKALQSLTIFASSVAVLATPEQQILSGDSTEHRLVTIPRLGFGTWNLKISSENTTDAVAAAIKTGYVHIDCAAAYSNQEAVGAGIAKGLKVAGKRRGDVWVTSKLWNDQCVLFFVCRT
jgi:diketogulonate reductase-like aldo/keto reductase